MKSGGSIPCGKALPYRDRQTFGSWDVDEEAFAILPVVRIKGRSGRIVTGHEAHGALPAADPSFDRAGLPVAGELRLETLLLHLADFIGGAVLAFAGREEVDGSEEGWKAGSRGLDRQTSGRWNGLMVIQPEIRTNGITSDGTPFKPPTARPQGSRLQNTKKTGGFPPVFLESIANPGIAQ